MVFEKLAFILQGGSDRLALVDIPLTSVDDGDVTQSEGDDPSSQDVYDIGSLVPVKQQHDTQLVICWSSQERPPNRTYIRSTFVKTPIVLVPSGSTSLAIFNPSEFAKSVLAAVTARMIAFGLEMNFNNISLICLSMSLG